MKVSVIIGIYNCESTLQKALDSLYSQTFQDFEIILCEDGSKDNTFDVAKQNLLDHSGRIVLLQNEHNMGLGASLNRCLNVARGEYIARMDGDDISLPERFEKEVRFLDEHPEYDIVSCPMIYMDEYGEYGRGTGGFEPTKEAFIGGVPHCHAPCMIRRKAYLDVNGYPVGKFTLRHEDAHLWINLYSKGYRGYNLDECLYVMLDDRNAAKRRNWIGRRNGVYAQFVACRKLHLGLKGYLYCFKPIIAYLMPVSLYMYFHKKRFSSASK